MIVRKKLPLKASDLLSALENLDPNLVPLGNIQSLVNNWPDEKNQSYEDLIEAAKMNPDQKWPDLEQFFIDLSVKPQIL